MEISYTISQPDEDGICQITMLIDGEAYSYHQVRCDMAAQWAMQEAECLAEAVAGTVG